MRDGIKINLMVMMSVLAMGGCLFVANVEEEQLQEKLDKQDSKPIVIVVKPVKTTDAVLEEDIKPVKAGNNEKVVDKSIEPHPTEVPEVIEESAAEPTEELKCSCFDGEVEYGVYSDDIDDIPDEVWDIINEMEVAE